MPNCMLKVNHYDHGSQNQNFTSGRKGITKSVLVKSESKSKDFTNKKKY